MATIEDVLASLDPPLKHELTTLEGKVSLLLIDPGIPAVAQRSMTLHEMRDTTHFRLVVLYAVNELRTKGSNAPLAVLPAWD